MQLHLIFCNFFEVERMLLAALIILIPVELQKSYSNDNRSRIVLWMCSDMLRAFMAVFLEMELKSHQRSHAL